MIIDNQKISFESSNVNQKKSRKMNQNYTKSGKVTSLSMSKGDYKD